MMRKMLSTAKTAGHYFIIDEIKEIKGRVRDGVVVVVFFFQAEDGIRDLVRSRGLGMCIRDSCENSD
mgnify:CR=1 FL=1